MLSSFLATQRVVGMRSKDLKMHLGPPTTYYDSEENCAYIIGDARGDQPGPVVVFLVGDNSAVKRVLVDLGTSPREQ